VDISANIKIIFELYEKCFKLRNKSGTEKEIEKIVEILFAMEEKQRKEILNKLLKSFPKSSELNQKIQSLINKKNTNTNKDKNKLKGKEKGNKLSLEKEVPKESRSKSQIKSKVKKSIKKIEEDDIKIETNKKLKIGENVVKNSLGFHAKSSNISSLNYGAYSVNAGNIGNLEFDGLFMDISKYQNYEREKNPFEGPSSFYKFYKLRRSRIKKKINEMTIEAKYIHSR